MLPRRDKSRDEIPALAKARIVGGCAVHQSCKFPAADNRDRAKKNGGCSIAREMNSSRELSAIGNCAWTGGVLRARIFHLKTYFELNDRVSPYVTCDK